MNFHVKLYDALDSDVNHTLSLTPQRWAGDVLGGPTDASITGMGRMEDLRQCLEWIGYRVVVLNDDLDPVWWGFVNAAFVDHPAISWGFTIDQTYNDVKVIFSYTDVDGRSQKGETDSATNSDSIARFGTKALVYSAGTSTATEADSLRDELLSKISNKTLSLEGGGAEPGIRLFCRGYVDTLGWIYYPNSNGLYEVGTSGSQQIAIGWEMFGSDIGFFSAASRLGDEQDRLLNVSTGQRLYVSGSSSNDGTYTVGSTPATEAVVTLNTTQASFDSADDVYDAGNGFSVFTESEMITFGGVVTTNAGSWWIGKIVTDGYMTVEPNTISNETPSGTSTFSQGTSVRLDESVSTELPGASITVTSVGVQISQPFELTAGGWTAASVKIRAKKNGTPASDLMVALCADSGGDPGSVLDSGTIAESSLTSVVQWIEVDLSNTITLNAFTTYHIRVSMDGANDPADFYCVEVGTDEDYADGFTRYYNGTSWVAAVGDDVMPFKVLGKVTHSALIEDILTQTAQFADVIDVPVASATSGNQYREGNNTGLDEIRAILDGVTFPGGGSAVLRWTQDMTVSLREELLNSDEGNRVHLDENGRLSRFGGAEVGRGFLPFGEWGMINLPDVPSESLAEVNPFYIERAEYNAISDQWVLQPRNTESPFAIADRIEEG